MRATWIGAVLALTAAFTAPAVADASPEQGLGSPARVVASRAHRWTGRSHLRHAERRHGYGAYAVPGPAYSPEPRYYPGFGNASPSAGFGAAVPVAVTLYKEAYIGRGLIYNTPPEPHWRSETVISVKY